VGENGVRSCDDESGCGDGLRVVRFEFVTGHLPADKGVERKVIIQTADDEVSIMMGGGPVRITFLSVAVRLWRHLEPMARPTFPIMRAGQQLIDERCDG